MSKYVRALLILIVLLSLGPCLLFAQEEKKNPGIPYQGALDYFGDLDLDRAYKWADMVIRDFPKSEEAGKAKLLKVVILTIRLQAFDMLSRRYVEGMRKAVLYEYRKKNRDLYAEASKKSLEHGKILVEDIKILFPYVGRPMDIKVSKNFDSLKLLKDAYVPAEMLKKGFPPTRQERERIEKHQHDMSFCFVLSRLLYGPSPGSSEKIAKEFEKRQILEGKVNWAGCMTAVGDWLIHYGAVCNAGWIDLDRMARIKDVRRARKGYEMAEKCFKEVIKSLEDTPYDKGRVHAEERIKEIQETLAGME